MQCRRDLVAPPKLVPTDWTQARFDMFGNVLAGFEAFTRAFTRTTPAGAAVADGLQFCWGVHQLTVTVPLLNRGVAPAHDELMLGSTNVVVQSAGSVPMNVLEPKRDVSPGVEGLMPIRTVKLTNPPLLKKSTNKNTSVPAGPKPWMNAVVCPMLWSSQTHVVVLPL
jgi:hypothetical protein